MYGLEEFGLALEMFTHFRLDPGHVVRVYKAIPVRQHVFLIFRVTEHGFPAAGELDAFRLTVEIPDAVIGSQIDQRITLLHLLEQIDDAHALQSGGE